MLQENKTCVKQSITKHMLLSNAQRKAHVDLKTPCIPVVNKHNTSAKKAGEYATSRHGRRVALNTLTEYHNLESFNGTVEKVHTCHLCSNDSQAPNGFVCKNPKHLYFGTISENYYDKKPKVRKRVASIGAKSQLKSGAHNMLKRAECIHCGYESNVMSITRWHNDNCKYNPLSARFKQSK